MGNCPAFVWVFFFRLICKDLKRKEENPDRGRRDFQVRGVSVGPQTLYGSPPQHHSPAATQEQSLHCCWGRLQLTEFQFHTKNGQAVFGALKGVFALCTGVENLAEIWELILPLKQQRMSMAARHPSVHQPLLPMQHSRLLNTVLCEAAGVTSTHEQQSPH